MYAHAYDWERVCTRMRMTRCCLPLCRFDMVCVRARARARAWVGVGGWVDSCLCVLVHETWCVCIYVSVRVCARACIGGWVVDARPPPMHLFRASITRIYLSRLTHILNPPSCKHTMLPYNICIYTRIIYDMIYNII